MCIYTGNKNRNQDRANFLKSEKIRKFMSECGAFQIILKERANQTNVRSIDWILPVIPEEGQ